MEIGSSLFKMYRSLKPNCQKKGNTEVLDKVQQSKYQIETNLRNLSDSFL